MTPYGILQRAIEFGAEYDFRPQEEVWNYFWKEEVISPLGERFFNIYPDSGIVHIQNPKVNVKRVVVGLDIRQEEILSAREFEKEENKTVDLLIGHHPSGRPSSSFPFIMKTQLGNLKSQGVSITGLEKKYEQMTEQMKIDRLSFNFNRTRDTAILLKYNYIVVHTPVDNAGAQFVQETIRKSGAGTLEECLEALLGIPEYRYLYEEHGMKPIIISGKPKNKLGKVLLTEFVGGEEGPIEVYRAMKNSRVDTIVSMHMSVRALTEAKKIKLNVIAAGHVASDSIGLNLFCDILEKEGIEIIPVGGFIRHSRKS